MDLRRFLKQGHVPASLRAVIIVYVLVLAGDAILIAVSGVEHPPWWALSLMLVILAVMIIITSHYASPRFTQRHSKSKPKVAAQKTIAIHPEHPEESPGATMKAAYVGAGAAIIAATIPLIPLFWPKSPSPVITIESVSFQYTSTAEVVTVNGTENHLGAGQLIFVVAALGPGVWVVGGPAFVTPGGTWTAELDIAPPYLGKFTVIPGLTPSCGTNSCEDSPDYISKARARLQNLGPNGFAITGSAQDVMPPPPPPPPPINSRQAISALLNSNQIGNILKARVIKPISSINSVAILDLSYSKFQLMGTCPITPGLPPPAAHSPVRTGTFNVPTLGVTEIGEQVVAYTPGEDAGLLDEVKDIMQGCGFTPIRGLPPDVMGFIGGPLKTDEWWIEDSGDVLIEVGMRINEPKSFGQKKLESVLGRLISAIEMRVGKIEK